jgi:hypothetical protein
VPDVEVGETQGTGGRSKTLTSAARYGLPLAEGGGFSCRSARHGGRSGGTYGHDENSQVSKANTMNAIAAALNAHTCRLTTLPVAAVFCAGVMEDSRGIAEERRKREIVRRNRHLTIDPNPGKIVRAGPAQNPFYDEGLKRPLSRKGLIFCSFYVLFRGSPER